MRGSLGTTYSTGTIWSLRKKGTGRESLCTGGYQFIVICLCLCRIPLYDEIVASDPEPVPSDSEDEEALEEQETFERKYNFRFEEPDANLVRMRRGEGGAGYSGFLCRLHRTPGH